MSLIKRGIHAYDRVCIASAGSPMWAVAYLGIMSAGAIPCVLYANSTIDSLVAQVQRCEARALMTAEDHIAAACASSLDQLPNLVLAVLWDEQYSSTGPMEDKANLPNDRARSFGGLPSIARSAGNEWQGVLVWRDVAAKETGAGEPDVCSEYAQRLSCIRPGMCAAIVATPGTSGQPKHVMMSHDNWSWTAEAVVTQIGLSSLDELFACLPIASATAQLLYIHAPLVAGCSVTFPPLLEGGKSWEEVYGRSTDTGNSLDPHKVIQMLRSTKATVIVGLGWMWDLIASVAKAEINAAQGTTSKKYSWALQQGKDAGDRQQGLACDKKKNMPIDVGAKGMKWGIAKRVVFMKIWEKVGLDRCRYAGGIGCPCQVDALDFLLSVGVPVLWMYGSAECSGLISLSSSSKSLGKLPGFRHGYSGRTLKGTVITVHRRHTGNMNESHNNHLWHRILVKGRNVMMGYFNDAARTAQVFDYDSTINRFNGLITGDCGMVDWGTQLVMVEAREEAIVLLSTNKEVLVSRIEQVMREKLPFLSNVVAIGHGYPFVVCLVTFETKSLETESSAVLAEQADEALLTPAVVDTLSKMSVVATTVEQARQSKALAQFIVQGVQKVNQILGPEHGPIKRFFILSEDLRLANDDLTPTLQLRRSLIIEKRLNIIEDIYDDSLPPQSSSNRIKEPDRAGRDQLPQTFPFPSQGKANGIRIDSNNIGSLYSDASAEPTLMADKSGPAHSVMEMSSGEGHSTPEFDDREQKLRWRVQIEEAVLEASPAISNVMVVGEDRSFISCLISLKTASEDHELLHEDTLADARAFNSTAQTVTHAKDDKCFRAFLVDSITRANGQLGVPELSIRKFVILLVDFLPAIIKTRGQSALTTSMRDSIKCRFEKIIDCIYEGAASDALQGTPAANFGGIVGTSLNDSASPSAFGQMRHPSGGQYDIQERFESADAGVRSMIALPALDKEFTADVASWERSRLISEPRPSKALSSPPMRQGKKEYTCDFFCGYTGGFSEVEAHEAICRMRPATPHMKQHSLQLQRNAPDILRGPDGNLYDCYTNTGIESMSNNTQSIKSVKYIPPDFLPMQESTFGTECGVGLELKTDDRNGLVISRVIPGSPADLSRDLFKGDIIIEINGQSTLRMSSEEVVAALKGDTGSLLRISVMRADIRSTVYLVREKIRDILLPTTFASPAILGAVEKTGPKESSEYKSYSRMSNAGATRNRFSIGAPFGAEPASPPSILLSESQRTLQVK